MKKLLLLLLCVMFLALAVGGCGPSPSPTATPVPTTTTSAPPTQTTAPSATPILPTATSVPPTQTAVLATTPPPGAVEITYIGNTGFLIVSEGKKILVDALWRGLGQSRLPAERRELLEQALPPFDAVDLVLTTHVHSDHFDPLMVGAHMENNPQAIFVSTDETVSALRELFPNFDEIQDRVRAFEPEEGEKVQATLNGIGLEIVNLHHGRDADVTNLGFLFNIGGKRLLHMGDSLATLSDLQVYQLPEEDIDIVFVAYFYLTDTRYDGIIREGVQANQIVPMHFSGPLEDWESILNTIGADFPEAIVFRREMQTRISR